VFPQEILERRGPRVPPLRAQTDLENITVEEVEGERGYADKDSVVEDKAHDCEL
jgi:hypothetical protein